MLSGILFLCSFWCEAILEGWANSIATKRLSAKERRAILETKIVRAEADRMKAHQECAALTKALEVPLTIYQKNEENPPLEPNIRPRKGMFRGILEGIFLYTFMTVRNRPF